MNVLVTGATGFVGGHLIPVLEARGHTLTIALRQHEAEARLPQSRSGRERRIVVVGDIDGRTNWHEALDGVDSVIHLAARAHVHDPEASDEDAFTGVNVHGTSRLVSDAIEANVRRFVLMSSIGAVTTVSDVLVTLRTPCEPDTAYGRSKLAAERALTELAGRSPMQWTILRPTLVYGPGNPGNMERLIALVRRGWPLPFGAIRNRRSFTFVGNLADLTELVLSHPNAGNAAFLVADGEDLSTPELIDKIAAHAGSRTSLLPVPPVVLRGLGRSADVLQKATGVSLPFGDEVVRRLESSLYVDVEPLHSRLQWTPPFSVEEGIRCTVT